MKRVLLLMLVCIAWEVAFSQLTVTLNFSFSDFLFIQNGDTLQVGTMLPKSISAGGLDNPNLPFFSYKILLPKDTSSEVKYNTNFSSEQIYNQIKIPANTGAIARDGSSLKLQNTRLATQSVLNPVRYGGIHTIDGLRFAYIEVTPFIYNNELGILKFVPQITIEFPNIMIPDEKCERQITCIDAYVRNQFVNPDDYYVFYPSLEEEMIIMDEDITDFSNALETKGNIVTNNKNVVDYLIITSNNLWEGFKGFMGMKMRKGLRTNIITTNSIASYYNTVISPEIIKQFLKDINMYTTGLKKKYLLLAGDIDIVPTMYYRAKITTTGGADTAFYNRIPSDIYYACPDLTAGNDGTNNVDDLEPQLYVSRLPITTLSEAIRYAQKLNNYEMGQTDGSNLLLAGYKIYYNTSSFSDSGYSLNKIYDNYIQPNWNGSVYKLYDLGTTEVLTKHTLFNHINNDYGIILENSHGEPNYWVLGNTIDKHYMADTVSYQNNYPGAVILTGSCLTNAFDLATGNCLSEEFVNSPNGGAIAYFGTSRIGYGPESADHYNSNSYYITANTEYSDLFNGLFLQHLFLGDIPYSPYSFGALTTQAKKDLILSVSGNNYYKDLIHSINAVGDPEVQVYTDTPHQFSSSQLPYVDFFNDYAHITAHTNCIISCVSSNNKLSGTISLSSGQSYSFYSPGGCFICMKKKNYIPYKISAFSSEDLQEIVKLKSVQNDDNTLEVYITTNDNDIPTLIGEDWILEVVDITSGKCIDSKTVSGFQGTLNTSSWSKGIYVLRTQLKNKVLTEKVIKK